MSTARGEVSVTSYKIRHCKIRQGLSTPGEESDDWAQVTIGNVDEHCENDQVRISCMF